MMEIILSVALAVLPFGIIGAAVWAERRRLRRQRESNAAALREFNRLGQEAVASARRQRETPHG